MLLDIESERFDPDSGDILSWHIAKRTAKEDGARPSTADAKVDSSDDQSSDSSSSSSSSDPDPQWEARRILNELGPKTVLKDLCVHLTTRKVHKLKPSGECTSCGRRLSGMFVQADNADPPNLACLICFAEDRHIRSAESAIEL